MYKIIARIDKYILLAFLIVSCSSQKQSSSDKIPMRIVSLAPSITETLFALGIGNRVIGVTSYCSYPEEVKKIEKTGGYTDANIEKIVSLHPDIVIITREHSHQKESLEKFGVRTLTVDHSDVSKLCSSFVIIGKFCGVSDASDSLITIFNTMITTEDTTGTLKPRVLLCIGRDSPGSGTIKSIFSVGRSTIYDQIIRAAGGVNAFSDSFPMYPSLSYEGVIALQPDIIIDAAATMSDFDCQELVGDWSSLDRVNAVKLHHVFCVQKEYATIPGPRIPLLVNDFRSIIKSVSEGPVR
ncbi:MAG: ABC transporter substrate-binding protein [Chitinispirillaceae bacterium]|nr:ABC transporter substrate-binding protein [Chitinispirillaceae bacterium]